MAHVRLDRAGTHLRYVQRALKGFESGNPYPVLPYETEDVMSDSLSFPDVELAREYEITRDIRLDPILSVRVGELVYNVRAVLDYLVYALAWHDTGTKPQGSHARQLQFPIDEKPNAFSKHKGTWLRGLTDEHVDLVARFQPFNGCVWTPVLRDLSNADKHREIVPVAGAFNTYDGAWYESLDAVPEEARERARKASPGQADVGLYATLEATFLDGRPVGPTLAEIHEEVIRMLYRFRKEFKYPPVG